MTTIAEMQSSEHPHGYFAALRMTGLFEKPYYTDCSTSNIAACNFPLLAT